MKFHQSVFSSVALTLSVAGIPSASGAAVLIEEDFHERMLKPGSKKSSKKSSKPSKSSKNNVPTPSPSQSQSPTETPFCADNADYPIPMPVETEYIGPGGPEFPDFDITNLTYEDPTWDPNGNRVVCIEGAPWGYEVSSAMAIRFDNDRRSPSEEYVDLFRCSIYCIDCEETPYLRGRFLSYLDGLGRSQFAIQPEVTPDRRTRSLLDSPIERRLTPDQCPASGTLLFRLPEDQGSICTFWEIFWDYGKVFDPRLDDEPRGGFCPECDPETGLCPTDPA